MKNAHNYTSWPRRKTQLLSFENGPKKMSLLHQNLDAQISNLSADMSRLAMRAATLSGSLFSQGSPSHRGQSRERTMCEGVLTAAREISNTETNGEPKQTKEAEVGQNGLKIRASLRNLSQHSPRSSRSRQVQSVRVVAAAAAAVHHHNSTGRASRQHRR